MQFKWLTGAFMQKSLGEAQVFLLVTTTTTRLCHGSLQDQNMCICHQLFHC